MGLLAYSEFDGGADAAVGVSRLTRYEDANDAERLSVDPAIQYEVGVHWFSYALSPDAVGQIYRNPEK